MPHTANLMLEYLEFRRVRVQQYEKWLFCLAAVGQMAFVAWCYSVDPLHLLQTLPLHGAGTISISLLIMISRRTELRRRAYWMLYGAASLLTFYLCSVLGVIAHGYELGVTALLYIYIFMVFYAPNRLSLLLAGIANLGIANLMLALLTHSRLAFININLFMCGLLLLSYAVHSLLDALYRSQFRFEQMLREQARLDPVTGLFNRKTLDEMTVAEWERARRYANDLSCLMISVNALVPGRMQDGLPGYDNLLSLVAKRCRALLRDSDVLARYGDTIFAALLPETGQQEAQEVAQRIRVQMTLFDDDEHEQTLNDHYHVCVSVATMKHGASPLEIIESAERSLQELLAADPQRIVVSGS